MSTARYLVGDVFERMAELPDDSIDLVLTSPPFLALRSYLPEDHPGKAKEIGSEPTPAAFIDTLLALTAEWDRLLAPHGSIAVELGDTYSGSGGAGGDYNDGGLRDGQERFDGSASRAYGTGAAPPRPPRVGRLAAHSDGRGNPDRMRDTTFSGANTRSGSGAGWPLAKSLTLIPELYRIALTYGINPLTGQESPAGRWRVRNVVRWHRPNPPVGALGDKYRPATTDMAIACKSDNRWFDLDAVRYEAQTQGPRSTNGPKAKERTNVSPNRHGAPGMETRTNSNPAGAPPLDTWVIPTAPYKGAHFATWPPALCTIPIESMCPREVCGTCGEPRRRIVESTRHTNGERPQPSHVAQAGRGRSTGYFESDGADTSTTRKTLGWTDCGHHNYRPGVVLDPFGGSGTTGAVSTGLGRDCVLIDIDERNAELARQRIGMFVEIVGAEVAA